MNLSIKALLVILSTVLSLLLLCANTIDSRKVLEEYQASADSKIKDNCNTDEAPVKDFELMPDASIYDNGVVNPKKQKIFVKEFELMPDISIYDNGVESTKQKSIVNDLELMPGDSVYDNGIINLRKQKMFIKEFELMPDLSIYDNSVKPTKQNSVVSDLELMPDATSSINPGKQKLFAKLNKQEASAEDAEQQNSVGNSLKLKPDTTISRE